MWLRVGAPNMLVASIIITVTRNSYKGIQVEVLGAGISKGGVEKGEEEV